MLRIFEISDGRGGDVPGGGVKMNYGTINP